MKVALLGLEQPFGQSIKDQLRPRGVEAFLGSELLSVGSTWQKLKRLLEMDIIHYLHSHLAFRYQWALWLRRKPVVSHWSGSDVLWALGRKGLHAGAHRWMLKHMVQVFLADSPEIAREVEPFLGYAPEVVRLLPTSVSADVLPLPPHFAVLSYWRKGREDFYGRKVILELARSFSDVSFIVTTDSTPPDDERLPNISYRPLARSLEDLWPQVSCLVRICEHDSLSAMVLEALARGRHVIYSKEFPHCRTATDAAQAKVALAEILKSGGQNLEGTTYVEKNFDPEAEALRLADIYGRLLAG